MYEAVTEHPASAQVSYSDSESSGSARYPRPSAMRIKIVLLASLLVAHILISLLVIVPGYLSIDESLYHMMSKSFSETGGLEIWTGYREFPSRELAHEFIRVYFGRPVSQYPYLFPIITLPFYRLAGFYGLFLFNSLAFIGLVAIVFATASRLFRDKHLALNSCLILILATYAWEYSQAAWPHATSTLFVTGAFYLSIRAYFADALKPRLLFAFAAGLTAGFAPGIRMDAFLVLPCLLLPFLFARPWRPLETAVVLAGALPGICILAVTNYIKFGVVSPFSYGTGFGGYTPSVPIELLALVGGIFSGAWMLSRTPVVELMKSRKSLFIGLAIAIAVAAVLVPVTQKMIVRVLSGAYMMLVDLRIHDMSIQEPALDRTPGGALVYIGGLKKSLLQSLPYLVILVIPLLALKRRGRDFPGLAMLFLMPVATAVFFAYVRDHGGLCLNLRFFVVALPFTSILAAYAIRDLQQRWSIHVSAVTWVAVAVVTAAIYFLLTLEFPAGLNDLEFPLLGLPLLVAGFLLVLIIAGELINVEGVRLLRATAWVFLIGAMVWSGLVAFFYDYPMHRKQRATNYEVAEKVLPLIPPDSMFFTAPYIDPFMRLIEKDRVRIGLPGQDQFKDFPNLVDFHLKAGRRVFAAFPVAFWEQLKAGPLRSYAISPVFLFPGSFVGEISDSQRSGR
ncbi:MAG: ArnT family glycosyltransferase [Desulfomonilaceae bacterium]